MEEFIIILLQFLFELALNVLANVPFDWLSSDRDTPESTHIGWRCFLWFVGGCVLGGISLLMFKHSLIHIGALRTLNLVIAPLAAAGLSLAIARWRAQANENIIPRNHFWQSFWFTLGLVVIRFAYATRV